MNTSFRHHIRLEFGYCAQFGRSPAQNENLTLQDQIWPLPIALISGQIFILPYLGQDTIIA